MRFALLLPAALLVALPVAAQDASQTAGGLLSKLGGGGATSGLGGLVPSVGSAGSGNVTGLLGYCIKNQLLGSTGGGGGIAGVMGDATGGGTSTAASGLLGTLTGKPGVTKSPGYLSGKQGVLQAGGTNLSLDSLGGGIKQKLCSQVLSRAKGMVGR